jgi:hypothetical protein
MENPLLLVFPIGKCNLSTSNPTSILFGGMCEFKYYYVLPLFNILNVEG